MKLDAIDRKILAAVQIDAAQTADQLALAVGISASAAQRRLKQLKRAGIVRQEIAIVSHEAVGRQLLMIVGVKIEREHEPESTRFMQRLLAAPEVMQCYYVTGRADYMLLCSFRNMAEYDDFSQALFVENVNVVSFETSVVIKTVKMGLRVPVE